MLQKIMYYLNAPAAWTNRYVFGWLSQAAREVLYFWVVIVLGVVAMF